MVERLVREAVSNDIGGMRTCCPARQRYSECAAKWQSPTRRDNPHYGVASLRITSVRGLGLTVLCPGNSRLFLCADRRLKLRQTLRTSKGDALQIFSASVSHAGGLDEADQPIPSDFLADRPPGGQHSLLLGPCFKRLSGGHAKAFIRIREQIGHLRRGAGARGINPGQCSQNIKPICIRRDETGFEQFTKSFRRGALGVPNAARTGLPAIPPQLVAPRCSGLRTPR